MISRPENSWQPYGGAFKLRSPRLSFCRIRIYACERARLFSSKRPGHMQTYVACAVRAHLRLAGFLGQRPFLPHLELILRVDRGQLCLLTPSMARAKNGTPTYAGWGAPENRMGLRPPPPVSLPFAYGGLSVILGFLSVPDLSPPRPSPPPSPSPHRVVSDQWLSSVPSLPAEPAARLTFARR